MDRAGKSAALNLTLTSWGEWPKFDPDSSFSKHFSYQLGRLLESWNPQKFSHERKFRHSKLLLRLFGEKEHYHKIPAVLILSKKLNIVTPKELFYLKFLQVRGAWFQYNSNSHIWKLKLWGRIAKVKSWVVNIWQEWKFCFQKNSTKRREGIHNHETLKCTYITHTRMKQNIPWFRLHLDNFFFF